MGGAEGPSSSDLGVKPNRQSSWPAGPRSHRTAVMASVTRNDGKNAMADDANSIVPTDEPQAPPSAPKSVPAARTPVAEVARRDRGGFFTIYKKGQGYWTRIGTVAGA